MIRILIVDDEPLARDYLRSLIAEEADCEIIGECGDGVRAVQAISEDKPDLVFLDVQMPLRGGLEVVETVGPENMPPVIFVTAFDRYAVKAFEQHALDYLLKPFSDERFAEALQRARLLQRREQSATLGVRLQEFLASYEASGEKTKGDPPPYLDRIPVKETGRVVVIDVGTIDWIEAADYYVNLHCGSKAHLLRETMHWLEERLDPARFARIHRGAIVRVDAIKELRPQFGGDYEVFLHDGTRLKLSRRRKENLERLLGRSF